MVLAAGAANIGSINNISASVTVQGNVGINAGTNHIGEVNISLMPQVSVLNVAGTAHIGEVNVSLMPAVVLAAGAANIGSINNISAAVVLAAGTNNIGTLNNISAVVSVNLVAMSAAALPVLIAAQSAGLALRMGGRVKTSASSTAADSTTNPFWVDKNGRQVVVMNHPSLAPSVSHGPKVVNVSTSASVALLPAQGSGVQNYVDSLLVTNGSGTLTNWTAYEVSATGSPVCGAYLAASGGGFTHYFNPPWRVSANTVLNMRVKPNASKVEVTIHFHVGVD